MAERITLSTPVAKPTLTEIRFERLILDVESKAIRVTWLGNNGESGAANYPTPAILNPLGALQPTGAALLSTLNTANLSTNSLVKRVLQRLQTDGYIPTGTVGGAPD